MIKRELSNYECMKGINLNLSDIKLASKIKIFNETCKKNYMSSLTIIFATSFGINISLTSDKFYISCLMISFLLYIYIYMTQEIKNRC